MNCEHVTRDMLGDMMFKYVKDDKQRRIKQHGATQKENDDYCHLPQIGCAAIRMYEELTAVERAWAESYLAKKWGIPGCPEAPVADIRLFGRGEAIVQEGAVGA